MNLNALIDKARHDGIEFAVMPTGRVKMRGHRTAIQRWTETLRPHRDEIAETLRDTGWLRSTNPDGTERIFWASNPDLHPDAEPYEIPIRQPDCPLNADDEQRIRGALAAIQETDQGEVDAVVGQCRNDADARSYWLRRATELRAPTRPKLVTCGSCQHFKRSVDHPHLGRCGAGCPEAIAGNWDTDSRLCGEHQNAIDQ